MGAFFDMDKTLIAENSGSLYMKHRYERGEIGGMELLKGLGVYVQYKLGVLDIRNWTRTMTKQFEGRAEAELEREMERGRRAAAVLFGLGLRAPRARCGEDETHARTQARARKHARTHQA